MLILPSRSFPTSVPSREEYLGLERTLVADGEGLDFCAAFKRRFVYGNDRIGNADRNKRGAAFKSARRNVRYGFAVVLFGNIQVCNLRDAVARSHDVGVARFDVFQTVYIKGVQSDIVVGIYPRTDAFALFVRIRTDAVCGGTPALKHFSSVGDDGERAVCISCCR